MLLPLLMNLGMFGDTAPVVIAFPISRTTWIGKLERTVIC